MKKSVKVTLIVAAVLVGLGLCLAVAGLAMGGRFSDLRNLHLDPATGQWEQTEETRDRTGDYTGSDYYLPAGTSITALDIDWISGEAEILVTNDADILVREQPERGISASYAMVVTEQDGVLKVRYAADEFLTLPDLPPKKLVVRLPRAVAENLTEVQLNSVSADFDVAALTVKEALIFDSVSGDLETDFITADSAEVNTVSGKIDLDGSFRQVIGGSTSIDVAAALSSMQAGLDAMEIPELLLLMLETSLVSLCMKIMSVLITVVLYGRMIEIYLYCSVSPIPFATMTNREWGQIGNNYLKGLFALGFQGFLIMICVGIYAVLVNNMVIADNLHTAIFSIAAYTVLLCFNLLKSGALAKSLFHAH